MRVTIQILLVMFMACMQWSLAQDFGIIFDAGSTKTNCYIFEWTPRASSSSRASPVQYGKKYPNKTGPLDINKNETEMRNYLLPFISWAKQTLKDHQSRWSTFPIYLKATAGMRVEPATTRQTLLLWVRNFMSDVAMNPFQFTENNAVIISGEEEGVYGWMGVNFALHTLGGPASQTFGAMDLGGMSTQVTFAYQPSSDILGDYQGLQIWGKDYRLYSHSYLEYGANAIELRIAGAVAEQPSSVNPCINSGHSVTFKLFNGTSVTQTGSSNPVQCGAIVDSLLLLNYKCMFGTSCAVGGEYMPPVHGNMTFYAFSAFAFSLIGDLKQPKNIDLEQIDVLAADICSRSWNNLTNSSYFPPGGSKEYLAKYCYQLTYIFRLLKDGYKFPVKNTNIIFAITINGNDLGWTSGSMLRDVNQMSFSLQSKSTAGLSDEGKKYRVATFVLAGLCLLTCVIFGLIIIRSQNSASGYDRAPVY